jgi:hypothetical protein
MLLLEFLYFLTGVIELLFKVRVLKRKSKPATKPDITEIIASWKQKGNSTKLAG